MAFVPVRQRRRRKLARPQELLDAAQALFVERGFAAARTDEVAARAGVSKGTLYRYYQSKEELLKAVVSACLSANAVTTACQATDHVGTSAELLRQALSEWWSQLSGDRAGGIVKLIITEVCSFPEIADLWIREVIGPSRQAISQVIRQGIADGEFRPSDPDAVAYSLLLPIIMMCLQKHAIGAWLPVDPSVDDQRLLRHHVDLVLDGLASRMDR
jgi:AcrR family transcriptional regulator